MHRVVSVARLALGIVAAFSAMTVAGPAAPAACSGPAYHALDFFVGNWVVTDKNGKQFATDRVSKEYGDCVIWEQWFGSRGSHGAGYSGYVPARHLWIQTFMDDRGTVLVFEGGPAGASVSISGPSYPKSGVVEQNHVIFRTLPHRVVEEYWTVSDAGDKTSRAVFDGFFHPAKN
jgi:hypothetical protein